LQVTVPEVPGYEDRPLGAAYLEHRLVGRVRRRPGEPRQYRLGGGGALPDRGGVTDDLFVVFAPSTLRCP
jgi:hypothetical protein